MRPGAAFVPFAMVAVVLLAGCTGSTSGSPTVPSSGDPVSVVSTSSASVTPDPTGSTSSPAPVSTAVPADVPTTGPNLLHKGERPPVMPVLATKHTAAGAVAFAKFFELTIDWGYATTSTAYMRHYYERSCITCKSIQRGLDNAAARHRHFVGGRMTIVHATDRGATQEFGAQRSVLVTYRLTSTAVIGPDGSVIDGDRSRTMKDEVFVSWVRSMWRIAEMVPAT